MTEHTLPMRTDRLNEIRAFCNLGDWYAGEWRTEYVEGDGEEPAYYRVKAADGTVLATLPDWAGPIATLLADAHEAVPELLAEIDLLNKRLSWRLARVPRDYLLDAILRDGGEWTVGRVKSLYAGADFGHMYRATIRAHLGQLCKAGWITRHTENSRRYYTLAAKFTAGQPKEQS